MRKTRCGWILSLAVGLSAVGPVCALPPAEEQLVREVEALYLPEVPAAKAVPGSPGATTYGLGCGSAKMRDVMSQWDELSGEAKARLEPLVQPTALSQDGVPSAPSAGEKRIDTAHFAVYYKPEGVDAPPADDKNGNGIPDYIDNAVNYLEKAYTAEVQTMGFTAPPQQRIGVHFKKLNSNGVTHPVADKLCWIELNSNILEFTKTSLGKYYDPAVVARNPAKVQESLLQAVCAHEFFHVVQAQYTWDLPDWWMEGNADWMGNEVFPESGFYTNNVGPHLEQPHVSLFTSGNFFEYSASLFPTYLSENEGGTKVVRAIWESCRPSKQRGKMANAEGARVLQAALVKELGNLPEQFMTFASYNVLRNYKDDKRLPQPPTLKLKTYPGEVHPEAGKEPEYYGANFIELVPTAEPGTLQLSGSFGANNSQRIKIITIDREGDKWSILKKSLVDGRLNTQIPEFGGRIRKVLVVVGSFTPGSKAQYTLSARTEP